MPDIAGDRTTTSIVSIGSTVSSSIEVANDHDWFRIELIAGQSVTIRLNSSGATPLGDPYLRIRDAGGNVLAQNDDGGGQLNSLLNFTATTTGTFYIDVAAWVGSAGETSTGDYTLQISPFSPPPVATVAEIARQLTHGYWNGNSHHFAVAQGGVLTVSLNSLTTDGANVARLALAQWADVIGISFLEVTSGAQITFDDNQEGAFSSATYSGGITTSAIVNVSTQWLADYGSAINTYGYQTYVHEIGHALGLGHAGNYNESAAYADALFRNDAWATTIMSYFSVTENTYFADQGFTRSYLGTPMLADIAAIGVLYGLSATTRLGGTTYGFNSTAGAVYDATLNPTIAYTVFDSGGVDTLDYSGFSQNQVIDLRDGQFSNVGGRVGNVSIALGTIIENAIGGAGNDTMRGNEAANVLRGNAGNDTIYGFGGNDVLEGLAGADILVGGPGADIFRGTIASHNSDTIVDFTSGDRIVFTDAHAASFTFSLSASTLSYTGGSLTLTGVTGRLYLRPVDGGLAIEILGVADSFNPLRYIASYGDLIGAFGTNAEAGRQHYEAIGLVEGRDPLLFNPLSYGASHVDLITVFGDNADALTRHYIQYGFAQGRETTFDALRYGASHADLITVFRDDVEALTLHYIQHGFAQGRPITFDALGYGASHIDLLTVFGGDEEALTRHYIQQGFAQGRSVTFDALAYGASHIDLLTVFGSDTDALARHYIQQGYAQGRMTTFDALAYSASYVDLLRTFADNERDLARHYIEYGFAEGRSITFDALAYGASFPDLIIAFGDDADALTRHFIDYGFYEGRTITFDALAYGARYADLWAAFGNDIEALTLHYLRYGFSEGRQASYTEDAYSVLESSALSDKPSGGSISSGMTQANDEVVGGSSQIFSDTDTTAFNQSDDYILVTSSLLCWDGGLASFAEKLFTATAGSVNPLRQLGDFVDSEVPHLVGRDFSANFDFELKSDTDMYFLQFDMPAGGHISQDWVF